MNSFMHMQAYLRLAKVNVAAEECVNASTSPSSMPALLAAFQALYGAACMGRYLMMHAREGQLPALERGIDIVEGAGDEIAAAEAIITYLKQNGHDLDADLSASQVGWSVLSMLSQQACTPAC